MCERNEIQRMKWEKAKEMGESSFPFLMYERMTKEKSQGKRFLSELLDSVGLVCADFVGMTGSL